MEVLKYLFLLNLIILGTNSIVVAILWRSTKILHYKKLLWIWTSGLIPMILSGFFGGNNILITGIIFSTNFLVYGAVAAYFSEISHLPFSWKKYTLAWISINTVACVLVGNHLIPDRAFWFLMSLNASFPTLIMGLFAIKRFNTLSSIIVKLGTFNVFTSSLLTLNYWVFYDNLYVVNLMYIVAMIFVVANTLLLPGIAVEKSVNEKAFIEYELKSRAREHYQSRLMSLGVISGGVAHEINNPLLAIILSIDQFERRHFNDESVDYYKIQPFISLIRNHSNRIAGIVAGLNKFSGASEVVGESCELSESMDGILIFYKEKARQSDVTLSYDNYVGKRTLNISYFQIVHALDVLLNNAYEAVRYDSNKWIRILVEDLKGKTVISIQNSGPPIPESIKEQIFQPFFTTKDRPGAGVGLSVAKGLIEKNKGELLIVEDTAHTTFKIIL